MQNKPGVRPGATTAQVLVLCTHNAARSVLGEALLKHWAGQRGQALVAHSAGSAPSGPINPWAIQARHNAGITTQGVRSKSRGGFRRDRAPPLSTVITVCDSAAAETCPVFLGGIGGQPVKVHCTARTRPMPKATTRANAVPSG